MANELVHKDVGAVLTQAEYHALGAHKFNDQAVGDIPYATTTTQIERLGIGSTYNVLSVSGGLPSWAGLKALGVHYSLANTYVSGTGTAGTDNTLQVVKTVVIPANTLTQVGDRIRVRLYWKGDTGSPVTCELACNGVDIGHSTDSGAASLFVNEAFLHYIDSAHANLIETGAYPATGSHSAVNVAGFDWASAQNVTASQSQVANNHIIVYAIFLDVMPKGVL